MGPVMHSEFHNRKKEAACGRFCFGWSRDQPEAGNSKVILEAQLNCSFFN